MEEKLYLVVRTTPANGELAYVARKEKQAQEWALDKLHDALSQANDDKFNYPDLSCLEVDEFQNLLIAGAEYGASDYRIFTADMSWPEDEIFRFIDDEDCYTFTREAILQKLRACEEEERKKARRR